MVEKVRLHSYTILCVGCRGIFFSPFLLGHCLFPLGLHCFYRKGNGQWNLVCCLTLNGDDDDNDEEMLIYGWMVLSFSNVSAYVVTQCLLKFVLLISEVFWF